MRAANHLTITILLLGLSMISCAKKEKESELSAITTVVTSAQELPECTGATTGQVYWVEEQEKLFVCNGKKFLEVAGSQGERGEKGDAGDAGSTGPAGSPANSGVWVFDKNGKTIGVLMDATLGIILFTNGAFAGFDLSTGEYYLPIVLSNGKLSTDEQNLPYASAWTDVSCTGTAYISAPAPKGSIIRTAANGFLVANGDELEVVGVMTWSTTESDGSCNDPGTDVQMNGYPITKPYTLPDGITLPLQTPLSFGFKTED
jgi:hypothetical protein